MSSKIKSLYKEILRRAKIFPSKNRARIYEEIRIEFRKNAGLTDKNKIAESINVAEKGLAQLSLYTDLKGDTEWRVKLDSNPMPRPKKD